MRIQSVKTQPIKIGESIIDILGNLPRLKDNSIIAITSKIISICQNRVVDRNQLPKYELIKQEAQGWLEDDNLRANKFWLTITNDMLVPSAGIDESNGDGFYILYPKDIQGTAAEIWQYLRQKNSINNLGIIITDSIVIPMRRGVIGTSIGWCGFEPLYSYIGKADIFGRSLSVSQINNLDALATAAVFMMGEGAEQTPIAIITDAPRIKFLDRPPTLEEQKLIKIPLEEDLYSPLLRSAKWQWKN